jgi:hypothetical protein
MFQGQDVHYEMNFLKHFIILQLLAIATVASQPKLTYDPGRLIDIGDQFSGIQVVRSVLLKNTGTEPLRIFSVEPSCGCTAALLERNDSTIAPSDSQHLVIMYTLENKTGAASKAVVITTNDPSESRSTIVLSGFITARLEILPPLVIFESMSSDTTYHTSVRLRNAAKDGVMKILSVTSGVPELTCRLSADSLAPGKEVTLEIVYKPETELKGKAEIRILTNQESDPLYLIPLRFP